MEKNKQKMTVGTKICLIIILILVIALIIVCYFAFIKGGEQQDMDDNDNLIISNTLENENVLVSNTYENNTSISNPEPVVPTENETVEVKEDADKIKTDYEEFVTQNIGTNSDIRKAIIDINNDGISELLVKQGMSEAEKSLSIYTYKNGEITLIGDFGFGHRVLYQMNNEDYLLEVYGHMGMEEVSKIYIKDGKAEHELISTREIGEEESYKEGDICITELVDY